MTSKHWQLLLCCFILLLSTHAQDPRSHVTGIVRTEKEVPLPNATIIALNQATGFSVSNKADSVGMFHFSGLPAGGPYRFTISFVGYQTQTLNGYTLKPDATFSLIVRLKEEVSTLDNIVVVGYGTQTRKSVTGAISTVKADELHTVNAISVDNLLQGKAAGLVITQRSAQPGSGMNVTLRGSLSPRGSNEPLYVIDGVAISSNGGVSATKVGPSNNNFSDGTDRSPLSTLNPSDIESISILKDASATAIYGSAAANGVILITTKKGKPGKATVTYSGSYSQQKVYRYWDMLNATQFMQQSNSAAYETWLYNNKYAPYGTTPAPATGFTPNYSESAIAGAGTGYNHADAILRTGQLTDHNVSFSGGTENTKYYAAFNYFNQQSLLRTTDFKRYSGRINLDQTFNKWLKLGINSMYSNIDAGNPSIGGQRTNGNEARQTNAALLFSPNTPLEDADGNLSKADFPKLPNPAAWFHIKDRTSTRRLLFVANLEARIASGIKGNVVFGTDQTSSKRDVFSPTIARLPEQTQENFGGYANNENNNLSLEGFLSYDKRIGADHNLSAIIGAGYYKSAGNSYDMTIFNFATDALQNNYLEIGGDKDLNTFHSWRWARTKVSQFARLNYTFRDRYILGFTARNDGSSAFPSEHKWGFFPGVSAAWVLSEENFLRNSNVISTLKLRGGWGTSGNESAVNNNFYYLTQYGTAYGYNYYIGGSLLTGILQNQLGNPNLKWETDATVNIGVDFGLFNNRLTGAIEIYQRTARDLLDFTPLPSNGVISQIAKNVGSTRSKGIELELKGDMIKTKNFNWLANLTLSHNRSYWIERNPEVALNPWINQKDEINAIYGWQTDGIFTSYQQVFDHKSNGQVLQPGSYAGNIRYIDQNNDGLLNGQDVVKLGYYDPKLNVGFGSTFQVGNFDLNANLYGAFGMKTYNGWLPYVSLFNANLKQNQSKYLYDAWTSTNTTGTLPGAAIGSTESNNPSGGSDFTLQSTYFMRLKNITLGYNLPQRMLGNGKFARNARVYADFQNIALLTNYKGLDPEMEQNVSPFPIPFTITLGVNISF